MQVIWITAGAFTLDAETNAVRWTAAGAVSEPTAASGTGRAISLAVRGSSPTFGHPALWELNDWAN